MGILDPIRRLFGRADRAMTQVDFAAMDAVHRAEDRIDEATGGRYYDAAERADEEAGELLERMHLDQDPDGSDDDTDRGPDAA